MNGTLQWVITWTGRPAVRLQGHRGKEALRAAGARSLRVVKRMFCPLLRRYRTGHQTQVPEEPSFCGQTCRSRLKARPVNHQLCSLGLLLNLSEPLPHL